MATHRLPLLGAAAGALVGLAVVGGLVATDVLDPHHPETGAAAEQALVEAWERSRQASYAMEGQFERVTEAGVLESAVFEAQRPPDRLRRAMGGIDGTLDGRTVTCTTDEQGSFGCAPNGRAVDYQADVDAEVERLDAYVSTDPPLYEVARDGECFLLQQRVAVPDPPYGRRARMCFDTDTGALRFLQVETADATDTFRATSVRPVATTDFRLEADPDYAVRTVRETTTIPPGAEETEPPVEDVAALSDEELFARCQVDGGERDLHTEMYERALSINDERWLGPLGPNSPCLLRGVLYYLERMG